VGDIHDDVGVGVGSGGDFPTNKTKTVNSPVTAVIKPVVLVMNPKHPVCLFSSLIPYLLSRNLWKIAIILPSNQLFFIYRGLFPVLD